MNLQVTILSPHFDDAAYSLTLTISRLIGNLVPVTLINCFTITKWTAVPVELKNVNEISKLRAEEDSAFNCLFDSAIRIVNLDFLDAPLRNSYIFQQKPLQTDEWKVVFELSKKLEENANGLVLCPLSIGNHIDHVICLETVIKLYKDIIVIFYEDLPYAARINGEEIRQHIQKLQTRLDVDLESHIHQLTDCTIDKESAIRVYKSQMNEEICSEILSHLNLLKGERLWGEKRALENLQQMLTC